MSRAVIAIALTLLAMACTPSSAPPTREVVRLKGNAYERGKQHGELLRSKIRSFYTTLLTASLFPYLGREQPDLSTLLTEYKTERYQNGNFAYELLLDSAKSIEKSLPRNARDELHGIADGCGLTYEQILVLNTFVDSVLAVRGVALSIRLSRAPLITRVEFEGAGTFSPFEPTPFATAVEVPSNLKVKLTLKDPDGIARSSVRLTLAGKLFVDGDPGLTLTSTDAGTLDAELTAQLPEGSTQVLVVSAGDDKTVQLPPPAHLSFMRDEEILFTVKGAGLAADQVKRPALLDGRTRPPPVAFALKGSATADGSVLLGQHFSLLDANTSHKHTVVFVHEPDDGPPFAVVGWAGITFGFSGLSSRGVGYACNPSDTLDNSVVASVLEQVADLSKAKLTAKGTPIGFAGRKVLETAVDADSAVDVFSGLKHAYGWSCVLADSSGKLRGVEVDSDVFKEGQNGVYPFDAAGDRLLATSAFVKNTNDIATLNVGGQRIVPQRAWSTFFYRARRAYDSLERKVGAGPVSVDGAQKILSDVELVDTSDSMNAVVLEVGKKRIHAAIGEVPATNAPFETVELP